jgi:cell division protein FtsQ
MMNSFSNTLQQCTGQVADYELDVRKMDFNIYFGKVERLDTKFNNFKAFYKKAHKDELLNTYKMVDLQFGNQVVCTKK